MCSQQTKKGEVQVKVQTFQDFQELVEYTLNAKGFTVQALSPMTSTSGERVLSIFVKLDNEYCGICPHCGRKCEYYDFPKKMGAPRERSWRSLDWGHTMVVIRAALGRVYGPIHKVVVEAVPWAYHSSGFTREFDKTVCCDAVQCSKKAVSEKMRITWDTTGRAISRVQNDIEPDTRQRKQNLESIGIDENYIRLHNVYLTIVVNHANSEVVYVAEGRNADCLRPFFESLSKEERERIKTITLD